MIDECPVNIECRLTKTEEFSVAELMLGEVAEIYVDKDCLTDGKPDVEKIDPLIFFMPNGPYRRIGGHVAEAFEVGKNYKSRQESKR